MLIFPPFFYVFYLFTPENVKNSPKIQNSDLLLDKVNIAVFGASIWINLISRKVWAAEKYWHFHTVLSHLKIISRNFSSEDQTQVSTKKQCGNFRIFLSFRIYVKLVLDNLEVLKLPFCHFWGSVWS